jgi:hypothetical protein
LNLTGIVLPALNVRNGLAKLPPKVSEPPMGARKPAKPSGGRGKATAKKVPLSSVILGVLVLSK